MKKEILAYIALFTIVLTGSLAIVLPSVEAQDQYSLENAARLSLTRSLELSQGDYETAPGSNQDSDSDTRGSDQPSEDSSSQSPNILQNMIGDDASAAENGDPVTENMEKLEELYRFIDKRYLQELDHEVIYESIVDGLFEGLDDPYSAYFSEEEASELMDTATGVYGGIGAYISKPDPEYRTDEPETYMVTIVSPFEGSPAAKSGLHAGNLISHIDGEPVDELTVEESSKKLRGEEGSKVVVTVYKSEKVSYDITITRKVITVPTVKYDMIDEDTAYLKIIQFTPITPDKVKEAIQSFRKNNYSELIIDLRYNPGGDFASVREIANFFLNEGTIVSTESRLEIQNRTYQALPFTQVPMDIPMAVLINEGSASASEILAGALQDNGRATLIGSTTFGKGLVQGVYPFGNDFFKLTISKYLTPKGTDIHEVGIEPSIVSKAPELSDEESKLAAELMESGRIENFADEHPDYASAPVDNLVEELKEDGFDLSSRYLSIMIKNEYTNRMDFPPIFDLEYDIPLNRAIEYLEQGLNEESAPAVNE
ncbi:MAG: S41 family peptidase [Spirochaetales bacterium]|nr:S41 family peptidase [Spirochaetales bacterium]